MNSSVKKISAALFLSGTTVLSLGAKLIPPMNVFPIFLKSKPTSQNIILDSEKESSKVSVIDEFQAKVVLAPGLKVVKVVQAGKGFVDRSAGLPKDIRGGVKLFHVRASEIKPILMKISVGMKIDLDSITKSSNYFMFRNGALILPILPGDTGAGPLFSNVRGKLKR